jgi:hypothetical protein
MNSFKLTVMVVLALALAGLSTSHAQVFQRQSYAAKFLCGEYEKFGTCSVTTTTACINDADCPSVETCVFREGPVKRGNYQTAINVYNPTRWRPFIIKYAILMFDSEDPPTGHEIPVALDHRERLSLPPWQGFEIDCPDIREVLLGRTPLTEPPYPFIKGWVVLRLWRDVDNLEVTAAYTSHGFSDEGTCVGGGHHGDPCLVSDTCSPGICDPRREGFSTEVVAIEPHLE